MISPASFAVRLVGIAWLLACEALLLIEPVRRTWFTPLMWTGHWRSTRWSSGEAEHPG
jgi:hypothetical protein